MSLAAHDRQPATVASRRVEHLGGRRHALGVAPGIADPEREGKVLACPERERGAEACAVNRERRVAGDRRGDRPAACAPEPGFRLGHQRRDQPVLGTNRDLDVELHLAPYAFDDPVERGG